MDIQNKTFYRNQYNVRSTEFSNFLGKTFGVMAMGLLTTGLTLMGIATYAPHFAISLVQSWGGLLLIGVQILLSFLLDKSAGRVNFFTSCFLFLVYSTVTGVNLSFIGVLLKKTELLSAVAGAFFFFSIMALYGVFTKKNLYSWGKILFFALISVFLCNILNLFIKSVRFDFFMSLIGVVLFSAITAYDINSLREMYFSYKGDEKVEKTLIILGASRLYVDFINLFLYVVKLILHTRKKD